MSGRFRRACVAGAGPALVVFVLFLAGGHADLLRRDPLGGFYDAQAHSLLHGRWDVPPDALKVEAFIVDGKAYTYFGPVPALLRLPIAALTHRLDGRLTQPSMLLGFVVALWMASRLHWRLRQRLRGDVPVSRREQWAVAGFTFLVGAGSSLTFLASRPIVYHEASVWGIALALGAFDALLAWLDDPRPRCLVVAVALSSLALLTRGSVGAGPLAAAGFLLAAHVLAGLRRPPRPSLSSVAPYLIAVLVPLALYGGVNHAKFGTLFSVPFRAQVVSTIDAHRQEVLAENGGTIFGVRYLPSTLLQYVRPDALRPDHQLPYLRLPESATNIGEVPFDYIDRSSSVSAAMPALTVLALVGLVAIVRRRLWTLGLLGAGAAAGCLVTLTIGFIAHRYTADAMPALVIGGATGLHSLSGVRWRRTAAVVLAVGGAASLLITSALTLRYQRLDGIGTSEDARRGFVSLQLDAPSIGDRPPVVRIAEDEPTPIPGVPGTLLVLGSCDGLYRSDGRSWAPVERTTAAGRFELTLRIGDGPRREELVTGVTLERLGDGRARFSTEGERGARFTVHPDRDVHLVVAVDRVLHLIEVRDGDRSLLDGFVRSGDRPAVKPDLSGTVDVDGQSPTVCRAAVGG